MYTIAELAAETGVTRRTIHFYVQQRVLPPPAGAGPRASYDDGHRLRLLAAPKLQAAGWHLDRIRTFFQRASLTAIARVVETGRLPQDEASWNAEGLNPSGSSAEALVRYRLAPGIELMVSASAPDAAKATIERSLPLIAQWFRSKE